MDFINYYTEETWLKKIILYNRKPNESYLRKQAYQCETGRQTRIFLIVKFTNDKNIP